MGTNVYLSCPMSCPQERFEDLTQALQEEVDNYSNTILNYWQRGNVYHENDLRNANIFVIHLPSNSYNFFIDDLSVGCRKEIKFALSRNISIYLAYRRASDNKFCFYKANVSDGFIEGDSYGHRLFKKLEDLEKFNKEQMSQTEFIPKEILKSTLEHISPSKYYYLMR